MVLLPFDAQDNLVPDDGKTKPWEGLNSEGKVVTFHPLYDADMRALLKRKLGAIANPAAEAKAKAEEAAEAEKEAEQKQAAEDALDDINLAGWLRGEDTYTLDKVRQAVKKRYHLDHPKISELVIALVLDEKLVPEDQVCAALKRHLPPKAA